MTSSFTDEGADMKYAAVFLMGLLALVLLAPGVATAADDGGMIVGTGSGVFPAGALFAGLSLSGLDFGQGVLTATDGTAVGTFHAILRAETLQTITVEGRVTAGSVAGLASFSGTATVNLGGGSAPLLGLPFQVALGQDGLQLTLDGTLLPSVSVSPGAIAFE